MQKTLFWGLVTTFALCINVIIAYLLIFVWELEFYYSLAIAFIFAIALVASSYIAQAKINKPKWSIKESLIIPALCMNYASAYFVLFVWKGEIVYVMLIFFFTSIIGGILIANPSKSLLYAFASLVLAAILFGILLVVPPSIYGHPGMVRYAAEIAVSFAGRAILIGIVFCLIGTLLGSLIGDAIR